MANYYVIGNADTTTTAASLVGTPYAGYTIVKEDTISNPYALGSYKFVTGGDNVVIGPTVNSDVTLQPGSTTTGFNLNVTILPNTNTFNVDVGTRAGLNYTEPNVTFNVTGSSPNVSLGGTDNTQVMTVNVADGAKIGNITGGGDANDNDVINIGSNATTGDITLAGGADKVTAATGSTLQSITTGAGDDTIKLDGVTVVEGISTDDGNDVINLHNVTINATGDTPIQSGTGNDTLTVTGTTTMGNYLGVSINMEAGDDSVYMGPGFNLTGDVIGGVGTDSVILEPESEAAKLQLKATLVSEGFPAKSTNTVVDHQISTDVDGIVDEFTWDNAWFTSFERAGIFCFAHGTQIETDRGPIAIENLAEGDLVQTRDNGLQPIRWIGHRSLSSADLTANGKLRPIRIRAGALGRHRPATDLVVSPQHRILVRSHIAQKMFGTAEVLVAAKQLCQIDGIDIAYDMAAVDYYHLLFDRHEVVISNGAESESLFTGPEAIASVGKEAAGEIFAIFPELRDRDYTPIGARTLATGRMGRKLAVRHAQNGKALVN